MTNGIHPENLTEGGRVYHELEVSELELEAADGATGYSVANAIRKQVSENLTQEAFMKLAEVGITALGFEFQVANAPGDLPPPFTNIDGALGLSMAWHTDVPSGADHGPYMFIFATAGESGPEAIGEAPTSSSGVPGSLFVANYQGETPVNPGKWKDIMATLGVDAGTSRGLLDGEVAAYAKHSEFLVSQRDTWNIFTASLQMETEGTGVVVQKTDYEHYEWFLSQLGFNIGPSDTTWDPPEHDFWQGGTGPIADWGYMQSSVGLGGDQSVVFPSGQSLPVIPGPASRNDDQFPFSDEYWDPNYGGARLLDTSGKHRDKQLSEDIAVRDYAKSGKSRISPAFVRFLQAFRDEVNKSSDRSEDLKLSITSGYRSWKYDRQETSTGWPNREQIENLEPPTTTGGEIWTISVQGQSSDVRKDLKRSEHCSGRAADLHIRSTTECIVTDDDAWLRKGPSDGFSPYQKDDTLPYEGESPADDRMSAVTLDGNWEINLDEKVTIVERDERTTSGGGTKPVAKVEKDGSVLGWTNEANLTGIRNPGLTTKELCRIALDTPVNNDIGGVSPCDTRIGIAPTYIHIDIKPRPWIGDAGPVWDYENSVEEEKDELVKHRYEQIDPNHGCTSLGGTPSGDDPAEIYGINAQKAWLRDPDDSYSEATDKQSPVRSDWGSTPDIFYNEGESNWQLRWGIYVTVKTKQGDNGTVVDTEQGPSGPVVRVSTPNGKVLGWTNFSNLEPAR